uniref:Uncharacterized protein n=1 Tax=Ciona intestinalis TaxID=7719 RepID=H2XZP4_CIOIN
MNLYKYHMLSRATKCRATVASIYARYDDVNSSQTPKDSMQYNQYILNNNQINYPRGIWSKKCE